ncbi:MAG: hypothetical protein QN193_09345 [Armatimonadota bacterium]|nr:hypothetical protein [Armatimonadota bacterium]MDR7440482.1 hypothetical protein [Armatimonadota bacterium]MDR7444500.1 hypothetical protein [Armatimonadota bacterium]MDR7570798.1 hypothetical protein [Armatimonadota bacterium]MDR7615195.1 hypothetical protein [Armatimonadota bacterium]
MRGKFELEVRFPVPDPEEFSGKVARLGGRLRFRYALTDLIYRPNTRSWDLLTRSIRLREHHKPREGCEVLFSHVEVVREGVLPFKRSWYPEGKVRLYAGPREVCTRLLEDLGFSPWFSVVKRDGHKWDMGPLSVALEQVEGLGWMGELEMGGAGGATTQEAFQAVERLGIPPQTLTPDPLPLLVARARGILSLHEESGSPPSNPPQNSGGGAHEGRDAGGPSAE